MTSWTSSRIATLTAGYAAGDPVKDIAEKLQTTRRSVIGKAYRLGLKHPEWKHERKNKLKYKPSIRMTITMMETQEIGEYTFSQIACRPVCHYPMGNLNNGIESWCGRRCQGSYCKEHKLIVYAGSGPKINLKQVA